MTKISMLAAAAVAALGAAACAGSQSARTEAASTSSAQGSTQSTMPAQSSQAASVTDAQLRSYVAARAEIGPLQAGLASQTPEQQTQTRSQIAAILQRHSVTATQFNDIGRMANEDRTFASRLAALQPNTFSDATLRAFAAASVEIDPISRSLATATPEQRTQATEQIRQILQRNNLDSATYNAIAARAQADPALAARIAELHRTGQSSG
ncbi:MAG: DUF4168 domain-containing protein [Caulobacteraceae bacterium]